MDIFLTGGSGSAGDAIIRKLVAGGHTVHALARSDSAAQTVTAAGATPVRGDLAELTGAAAPAWFDILDKMDVVVHAAAYMEFWGPDDLFVERNLVPTRALYQAAVTARVRRFVLLSAASVSTGTSRASTIDETSETGRPNIAYSRVKLRTEQELLALPHGDTALVILRPPFLWGKRGANNLQGFVESVEAGRFSWIDGGRHLVDFCHFDNLAHAISLATTRGEHGLTCYITDGRPMPARDFFTSLLATRGLDVSKAGSVPRLIASTLATLMETAAKARRSTTPPPLTNWIITFMGRDRTYDITRARTHLGYAPVTTVDEGLRQMSLSGKAHR
ncbi:3-beta hydroxysteroid dehydrogenase [Sphaerisporangium rufum]|uniref:3-beta hydroxysteroid dehydrogenase n=1 Tax=Sphaerisporangium rufum TaxID=1381558 RepID=A0A919V456_9ACTN|nr:NAD-dependent epimerase/dehydratase family protein [Sphaerisporangium rufum]GII81567.1 3-beta hydroxysteroid dehydrogenase [Sphaerisporangium rufum]